MNNIYRNRRQIPISEYQKRFFFEWALSPFETIYNSSMINKFVGELDKGILKQAVEIFVKRNDLMYAQFSDDGKHCYAGDFELNDFFEVIASDSSLPIESQIRELLDKPYDLTKDVLFKFYLLENQHDNLQENYFIVTVQHIIADAITALQINSQIENAYNLLVQGKEVSLVVNKTFEQAIEAEQENINEKYKEQSQKFWLDFIGDTPLNTSLPYKQGIETNDVDNRLTDKLSESIYFDLSNEDTKKLRAFAKQKKSTVFLVLSAIYGFVVSRYSNQDKLLISYPINMRPRGFNEVIGCFVNNILLKIELDKADTLDELIAQLGVQRKAAKRYQGYALTNIIQDQRTKSDSEITSFFNVGITQANLNATSIQLNGLDCSAVDISNSDKSVNEIGMLFDEYSSDAIKFKIEFRKTIFEKELMERFIDSFKKTLHDVIEEKEISLKDYSTINSVDLDVILNKWNDTDKPYTKGNSIGQLFELQVAKTPGLIAVVCKDQELTYSELDEKSNQLARHIQNEYELKTGRTLSANTLVALYLDRSIEMIIGIVAVLKAGGAYVPIDGNSPQARVDYLLEDTQAELILSSKHLDVDNEISLPAEKIIYIDQEESLYVDTDNSNLPIESKTENLAYVIYTSGTTGQPKGVMLNHKSVINYVNNVEEVLKSDINRIDFSTNIAFDLSVTTTLCALLLGKKIFIYPGKQSDIDAYAEHLVSNKIDFIKGTPSLLANMPLTYFKEHKIKQAFVGGEKLEQVHLDHLNKYIDISIDEYGPTEATVGTTFINKTPDNKLKGIGKPYHNYKTYILSSNLIPVPTGVVGELFIGGAGVAEGYLNRPELTAERFIDNPFCSGADKGNGYTKMYKTGDLARWLPEGNIEFLGRNDDQVKIRGYRIELGEIEHALLQIKSIKQSCVIARNKKTKTVSAPQLAAYFITDGKSDALENDFILDELSKVLPSYMLPKTFMELDSFPLTQNGKLDRSALPETELVNTTSEYVAPRNEIETKLCTIWQDAIEIEKVGVSDEFFRIGGDSVLSIHVAGLIRLEGFNCLVKDIFECKTIQKLVQRICSKEYSTEIETEQGELTGSFDLLPIQQWFAEKVDAGTFKYGNHWNQSFLIRVPELKVDKLEAVITDLVNHHDVLRLNFSREQSDFKIQWKQNYQAKTKINPVKILDLRDCKEEEVHDVFTEWQSGFDLEKGNLFQIGYVTGYKDKSARIYFAMHHLVADTVSWRILTEDIQSLYEGKSLGSKGSSYRQWVDAAKEYVKKNKKEINWWKNQLNDKAVPELKMEELSKSEFELTKAFTTSLLQNTSNAYQTEINDLLLTAFVYALDEIKYNGPQSITLEGHGREEIKSSLDISRTAGWFTSMFPVKLETGKSIKDSIQKTKDTLRKIPNKGIGFGMFATEPKSGFGFNNLPPISFNYLGKLDSKAGAWQIVIEDSGKSIHPANHDLNVIDINGYISNGKLGFRIVTKLGSDWSNQLSDCFKNHIIKVTEHCIEKLEKRGASYTPSDFNTVQISQELLDRLTEESKVDFNQIEEIYPANSLQQGFVYHAISKPEDDAYRVQFLFDYHEKLDPNAYIKAWKHCIEEYPILRTAFNWEEELIQIIYKRGELKYELVDISHLKTEEERDEAITTIQINDRKKGFDLTEVTLFRIYIIKQTENHYTVLKTDHHSIADGWSGPILFSKLHEHYQSLKHNEKVIVKEDTAYLQTQEYIAEHRFTSEQYWETALNEIENINEINTLLTTPIDQTTYQQVEHTSTSSLEIEGDVYKKLKKLGKKEGITTNVVVQFIWHKLLQVYSNNQQSIVGTTISGRSIPVDGIEKSVGLYINTLPLIIDWENENTILEQLIEIQTKITEMNSHSFAELAKLQQNGQRLFHSLLIFENYPTPVASKDQVKFSLRNTVEKVDYPLSIIAYEHDDALSIKLQYDNQYLSTQKAKQHLETLQHLLEKVLEDPKQPHKKMSLLNSQQLKQLICKWNLTESKFPKDKTIQQLFEDAVSKDPYNTALVYENQSLSYHTLNEKSNQLARYIREEYLKKTNEELTPDTFVALFLDRSLEMIIGILAVLKAGGAYVPMDPSYPQDRIDFILEDTQAQIILGQRDFCEESEIELPKSKLIHIDLIEDFYVQQEATNLPQQSEATNLSYLIYTSGTTGKPKGVMVNHRGVNNYTSAQNDFLKKPYNKRFYLLHSYAFDTSISCIFGSLCHSNTLVITNNANRLSNKIFNQYNINVAYIPPAFLTSLEKEDLSTLQSLIVSGELSNGEVIKKFSDISIINEYGPTEGTVGSTYYYMDKNARVSIIGKLVANKKAYILDWNMNPVPIGVIGELYIGGEGISPGYLNRPELTAERFVPNPFATEIHIENKLDRLYKTGDLVKWLADGNMEFLGRNDNQIKIRGFRIELGEIENAILQIPCIKQSCVLGKDRETDNGTIKYLVAYYVLDVSVIGQDKLNIQEILQKVLPDYMIPSELIEMDVFPLTTNGKLDTKALPIPDFNTLEDDFIEPASKEEESLCSIWQEILGLEKIGTTDDFFKKGGNSILALQTSHRMSKALNVEVSVSEIFKFKSIKMIIENTVVEEMDSKNEEWEFSI
ncbi:MAG: amino acid adenylation domain-containing protein [Flavobacteriales bacterium]|nr:amino acid adenylation domain-containing protein [Flavobacteriales bacterium]